MNNLLINIRRDKYKQLKTSHKNINIFLAKKIIAMTEEEESTDFDSGAMTPQRADNPSHAVCIDQRLRVSTPTNPFPPKKIQEYSFRSIIADAMLMSKQKRQLTSREIAEDFFDRKNDIDIEASIAREEANKIEDDTARRAELDRIKNEYIGITHYLPFHLCTEAKGIPLLEVILKKTGASSLDDLNIMQYFIKTFEFRPSLSRAGKRITSEEYQKKNPHPPLTAKWLDFHVNKIQKRYTLDFGGQHEMISLVIAGETLYKGEAFGFAQGYLAVPEEEERWAGALAVELRNSSTEPSSTLGADLLLYRWHLKQIYRLPNPYPIFTKQGMAFELDKFDKRFVIMPSEKPGVPITIFDMLSNTCAGFQYQTEELAFTDREARHASKLSRREAENIESKRAEYEFDQEREGVLSSSIETLAPMTSRQFLKYQFYQKILRAFKMIEASK
jgi:hypothetical protein